MLSWKPNHATYLVTGVGTGKKDTWTGASQSGSRTRLTKVTKSRDEVSDSLLLTETSFNGGHQSGNKSKFGEHDEW